VRDTIARQFDVDKSSVQYEVEPGSGKYRNGTITFAAKKGRSIDLQKLRDSIRATRLGGKTRSAVNYLEITAVGEVVAGEKETLLKVHGQEQQFLLGEDPSAKPKEGEKTPYQRLTDALAKGAKTATVTGRVASWSGRWPEVLGKLAGETGKDATEPDKAAREKRTLLIVKDFQLAGE
jgi:hypothetical protein